MPVRRLLGAIAAVTVIAFLVTGWPAGAQSGTVSDPQDTPESQIDVKVVTHSDSGSTITYTFEAYEDWPTDIGYLAIWDLYLDGDATSDACVWIERSASGFVDTAVYDECGAEKLGDATVSRSGKILTVQFDIAALRAATTPLPQNATSYRYRMQVDEDGNTDFVPDEADEGDPQPLITHTLGSSNSTTSSTGGGGTTSTTAGGGTTTTTTSGGSTTSTTAGGTTSTTRPSTTTTTAAGGGAATTTTTAGTCPNPSPATVTPSRAVPGQEVTVRGGGPSCFRGNATLTVVYTSDPVTLGTTTSDAFGQYAVIVKIPRNSTAGAHKITVSGPAAGSGTHQSIGGVTISRGGSLPRTGSDAGDLVRTGAFAVGAGALFVAVSRRRRELVLAGVRHQAKHFRRG